MTGNPGTGARDPVSAWWADAGHVPQLEAPDWTSAQIRDWLATDAADAADRTRRR